MSTAGGPERGTRTLRGGRAVVVWMWLSGKPRFGSILAKRPSSNGAGEATKVLAARFGIHRATVTAVLQLQIRRRARRRLSSHRLLSKKR